MKRIANAFQMAVRNIAGVDAVPHLFGTKEDLEKAPNLGVRKFRVVSFGEDLEQNLLSTAVTRRGSYLSTLASSMRKVFIGVHPSYYYTAVTPISLLSVTEWANEVERLWSFRRRGIQNT